MFQFMLVVGLVLAYYGYAVTKTGGTRGGTP